MVEQSFETGYQQLLDVARENIIVYTALKLPEEAVGIIDNKGNVHPLINARRSEGQFAVSSRHVGEALERLAKKGLLGIAIYHSHPAGRGYPSPSDVEMFQLAASTVFIIHGTDIISAWICETETDEPIMIAKVPNG